MKNDTVRLAKHDHDGKSDSLNNSNQYNMLSMCFQSMCFQCAFNQCLSWYYAVTSRRGKAVYNKYMNLSSSGKLKESKSLLGKRLASSLLSGLFPVCLCVVRQSPPSPELSLLLQQIYARSISLLLLPLCQPQSHIFLCFFVCFLDSVAHDSPKSAISL